MTVGELKEQLNSVPDNFELEDYYSELTIEDIEIDTRNEKIYLIMEDD